MNPEPGLPGRGASKAYLIGGNVQQAVTMRVLNVNATGRLWNLPMRSEGDAPCSPDAPAACNFNRPILAVEVAGGRSVR